MKLSLAILLLLVSWTYVLRKTWAQDTSVSLFVVLDGCPAWRAGARDAAGFWEQARQTWLPNDADQTIGVNWLEQNTHWVETTWPDGRCDVKVILKGSGYERMLKVAHHEGKRDVKEENIAAAADCGAFPLQNEKTKVAEEKRLLHAIRADLKRRWVQYTMGNKRSIEGKDIPYISIDRDSKVSLGGRLDKPSELGKSKKRSALDNPLDPSLWQPSFPHRSTKMAVFASADPEVPLERQPDPEDMFRMQTTTPWDKDMMSPPYSDGQYSYPPAYGSCLDDNGVHGISAPLYLIDVGMDVNHIEFLDQTSQTRATVIQNFYPSEAVAGNFHATATGSKAVGRTLGTCPGGRVFNVKALSNQGSGSISDIITGVYTCRQHAITNGFKAAVINLSLGGPDSSQSDAQSFIDAFKAFENDVNGKVVLAAGNSNSDACSFLPAGVNMYSGTNAMVVGAVDQNFLMAYFSNWGSCLTLFAPGVSVPVAVPCQTNDCYSVSSGTSFSSPSVAGAIMLHDRTQPANYTGNTLVVQETRDSGRALTAAARPDPVMHTQLVNYGTLSRAYLLQTASTDLVMGMPAQAYNAANVFPVITANTYMNTSLIAYLVTPADLANPSIVKIPDPPSAYTTGQIVGAASLDGPCLAWTAGALLMALLHLWYLAQ